MGLNILLALRFLDHLHLSELRRKMSTFPTDHVSRTKGKEPCTIGRLVPFSRRSYYNFWFLSIETLRGGKVLLAFRVIQLVSFISKVTSRSRKRNGRQSPKNLPYLNPSLLQLLLPNNSKWPGSRTHGRQPPSDSSLRL